MKSINRSIRARTLILGVLLIGAGNLPTFAADDNETKLKDLERAMSGKPEGAPVKKKVRTRAIVFDAAQSPSSDVKASSVGNLDCANLPGDAKSIAVDFVIRFQVGSAKISASSEATLSSISKILELSPDRCVIVEGHTDSIGNADKNLELSKERAGAVVDYIASRGNLDRKRLVPIGKGALDPITNLDPRNPKNRRVVFKVVSG